MPTKSLFRVLLVAGLVVVGCTGDTSDTREVYESCDNSEQCGFPNTVFECLATSAGKVCTRHCQDDVDVAAEGIREGMCVENGMCDDFGEGCCLVQSIELEGGVLSVDLTPYDRYEGQCEPRAPDGPGADDDDDDDDDDAGECEGLGDTFYTSCSRDSDCGPVLTCMRPCTSCDETCQLPCGGDVGGDAYCERYGAGSCDSSEYEVCEEAPTLCPEPVPADHGSPCDSNADCESELCITDLPDQLGGICTIECLTDAECPGEEDCRYTTPPNPPASVCAP